MKIIVALLVFSIIIIFHEFGHLLLAKKNGITVVEFSVGLGPTIIGKEFGGTKYSLKLLPFGGACQMLGEDMDSDEVLEGSYYSRSVWQRMAVILAGPFFNFILAFILALFVTGFAGYDPAFVMGVNDNSPAYEAGLKKGDRITSINGHHVSIGRQVDTFFMYENLDSTPVKITYIRENDGVKCENATEILPVKVKKYLLGFSYLPNDTAAQVSAISEGLPMSEAGMKEGDVIVKVNGYEIKTGSDLNAYFTQNPLGEESVDVTYERDGEMHDVNITPVLYSDSYSLGFTYNLYRYKCSALDVIKYSFVEVGYWIDITVKNVGMLVTGRLTTNDIGGAVAIVDIIGDSYEETKAQGSTLDVVIQMMYICILLSANLGVMNLLPIPALDGGKFLFLVVEAFMRKPLNRKIEGVVNMAGFVLLMLLMVFVFFNDIRRLFF